MKKIFIGIIVAVSVMFPLLSSASFVIHLKDGGQILVDAYWKEGNTIRVKKYGGMIGISRALVSKIEEVKTEPIPEVKKVPEEKAPGEIKVEEKTEKEKPAEISEEERKVAEQEKASKMQVCLEEKAQIMQEMETATTAFNEAKATGNKGKKNQAWNELLSVQKKFGDLRDRVMAENGGEIPAWWDDAR